MYIAKRSALKWDRRLVICIGYLVTSFAMWRNESEREGAVSCDRVRFGASFQCAGSNVLLLSIIYLRHSPKRMHNVPSCTQCVETKKSRVQGRERICSRRLVSASLSKLSPQVTRNWHRA